MSCAHTDSRPTSNCSGEFRKEKRLIYIINSLFLHLAIRRIITAERKKAAAAIGQRDL